MTSVTPVPPLVAEHPDLDVDDAYRIQQGLVRRILDADGGRAVGYKLGLTSAPMQQMLGVDQPDYAPVLSTMVFGDGHDIDLSRYIAPKVEAEIALVLEKDLAQPMASLAEVISAVAYAVPAIEIVGSRIENWNIKLLDTVADNASSGLFVLGGEPKKLDAFDLRMCGMVMERRGEPVSVGAGVACLGNPLNAVLWLARTMVEVGAPLRAGDVIMSGALGPMVTVAPGDVIDVRINGLGSVRAAFAG
jgi:2-keto-4-pentenoate hydratase